MRADVSIPERVTDDEPAAIRVVAIPIAPVKLGESTNTSSMSRVA